MPTTDHQTFTGGGEPNPDPLPGAWRRPEPYRAEDTLIDAVNMALALRRPLLLEGDPGAGKTRLAYAVAYEMGWPLHTCYVRSTSRAEDLLYEFDQLNRLYDIQASCAIARSSGEDDGGTVPAPPEKTEYLAFQPLGMAVKNAADKGRPSVVLIDEIDKADIDFPNDLLQVLEEWRFSVKEIVDKKTGKPMEIDALQGESKKDRKAALPLVIVTSNREKELPPAFLRRCLYYFIEFPKPEKLQEILSVHFGKGIDERFQTAVAKFMELRGTDRKDELFSWRKKPGASELIDWASMLEERNFPVSKLKKCHPTRLPFLETLVKSGDDRESLMKKRHETGAAAPGKK